MLALIHRFMAPSVPPQAIQISHYHQAHSVFLAIMTALQMMAGGVSPGYFATLNLIAVAFAVHKSILMIAAMWILPQALKFVLVIIALEAK
jgi:hypothetical protein